MIDDVDLLEVDDDYYAFLNLPRDVSYHLNPSVMIFSRFAIFNLITIQFLTGDFRTN